MTAGDRIALLSAVRRAASPSATARIVHTLGLICLLSASVMWAGCAGRALSRLPPGQVQVSVSGVGTLPTVGPGGIADAYLVMLTDASGRTVEILVSGQAGRAILLQLRGIPSPSPAADLANAAIAVTGNHVDFITIAKIGKGIGGTIFLDGGRYRIKSTPSEALALALKSGAPIYASDDLLSGAALAETSAERPSARLEHGFGITVQELTPELARYFGVAPDSALLVADVAGPALKAGVRRGDLIEAINGVPMRTLENFRGAVAQASMNSVVKLGISRDGQRRTLSIRPESKGSG